MNFGVHVSFLISVCFFQIYTQEWGEGREEGKYGVENSEVPTIRYREGREWYFIRY